MNLQQTIDSAVKEFDKRFYDRVLEGWSTYSNKNPLYNDLKSHLTSSIKKAVEEVYEDLAEDVEALKVKDKDKSEPYTDERYDEDGRNEGYNDCLSLIEKKKSLFINKNI